MKHKAPKTKAPAPRRVSKPREIKAKSSPAPIPPIVDKPRGDCRFGPGTACIIAAASPPSRTHVHGTGTIFTETFKVGDWFTLDPDGIHHTSKVASIGNDELLRLRDPYLSASGTEYLPYAKGRCPV